VSFEVPVSKFVLTMPMGQPLQKAVSMANTIACIAN
jgi:hypothetical protein